VTSGASFGRLSAGLHASNTEGNSRELILSLTVLPAQAGAIPENKKIETIANTGFNLVNIMMVFPFLSNQ
jgi:hypothetical protein